MTVTLDAEEWNRVLAVLAQGPWQAVNPLILKIGEQMRQQTPKPNGPDIDAGNELGINRVKQ